MIMDIRSYTYCDEEVGLQRMEQDQLHASSDFFEGCLRMPPGYLVNPNTSKITSASYT